MQNESNEDFRALYARYVAANPFDCILPTAGAVEEWGRENPPARPAVDAACAVLRGLPKGLLWDDERFGLSAEPYRSALPAEVESVWSWHNATLYLAHEVARLRAEASAAPSPSVGHSPSACEFLLDLLCDWRDSRESMESVFRHIDAHGYEVAANLYDWNPDAPEAEKETNR